MRYWNELFRTLGQTLFDSARHKPHLWAAGIVALVLTVFLAHSPSNPVQVKRKTTELDLSIAPNQILDSANDRTGKIFFSEIEFDWHEETVRSGDSLSTIFHRVGLDSADVYELTSSGAEGRALSRIMPGEKLAFAFDQDRRIARIKYIKSRLESQVFSRRTDGLGGYQINSEMLQPEIKTAFRQAEIEDSLFLAAERAGLPRPLIMELANIFGWDIDFALDIRKGDSFAVLFEEEFLQGEKIGNGAILAAEFINQGRGYVAARYVNEEGRAQYFAPNGAPMRKAFLRAPLDFTRVSSNFNPNRLHPVFKSKRPHRGVDYAAPRGTPVYAAGDGKVIAAGYSRANGNYVFLQHGGKYVTKYLHLSKRLVNTGQHVIQKKVIGSVGSTGYATGPHLHYEFLVNGVHRNPRTVELPKAAPIAKTEQPRFLAQITPLIEKLAMQSGNQQLAALAPPFDKG